MIISLSLFLTYVACRWSFIKQASIRIGDDILEVVGRPKRGGQYFVNGVEGPELEDGDVLDGGLSGHEVKFRRINGHQIKFRIDLDNGESIALETFKKFVRVNLNPGPNSTTFMNSRGLVGRYPDGAMIARNNQTNLEGDPIAFGKEWQVLSHEPKIFHNLVEPQHPQECTMPTENRPAPDGDGLLYERQEQRRRLGEALITKDDATKACAKFAAEYDLEACVFDGKSQREGLWRETEQSL